MSKRRSDRRPRITDKTETFANDALGILAHAMATGSADAPILAQEANGQRELVRGSQLPRTGLFGANRPKWEAIGFKILGEDNEKGDRLFVDVEIPEGWSKRPTNHPMWSDLIDDRGRKRASVFYKAAFYDRNASLTAQRRFAVDVYHAKADDKYQAAVTDHGLVVFTSRVLDQRPWDIEGGRESNQKARDAIEAECEQWLVENGYPDWRDPFAYWS